jgi:hypothetical protein
MRHLQMSQHDGTYRVLGRPAGVTLKTAMITLIVMSLGLEMSGVAFAQSAPRVPADRHSSDPRLRAPIGARQPRPQDLPPQVLRNEGQVSPSQRDFDSSLQICRGC